MAEERSTVKFKKEEFTMREKIKEEIGKGKVSKVKIEYAPINMAPAIKIHTP